MRLALFGSLILSGTLTLCAGLAGRVEAQGWGGGEYERRLRPGYNVPFDGAPYTQIYNYETGSFFYPGMNPRQLIYQDYLDRLDRAYKFGYRIPEDPFGPNSPYNRAYYNERPRIGVGVGAGFFRWR
jgi:hypothetical protein